MKEIVQKENKILREKAKEISLDDISLAKIQNIIKEMKETLAIQEDGVALAAPQVEKSIRLFIISEKAYKLNGEEDSKNKKYVFINPQITKLSKKTKWLEEGCLSVVGWFGFVKRSTNCTVEAYDENGEKFVRGAGGLLAQAFQHEVDHLNGILFVDKAKDLKKI